jgi:hypothetical protein
MLLSGLQDAEPATNFVSVFGKLMEERGTKLARVPSMPDEAELPTAQNAALHARLRS